MDDDSKGRYSINMDALTYTGRRRPSGVLYSLACLPSDFIEGHRDVYDARYRGLMQQSSPGGNNDQGTHLEDVFDVLLGIKTDQEVSLLAKKSVLKLRKLVTEGR